MGWQEEMAQLAGDVVDTFGVAAGTVTLRRVTPGAFNTTTQTRAATTLDAAVKASRSKRRQGVMSFGAGGPGGAHVAETDFLIDAAELAATAWGAAEPKDGDLVVEGTKTYSVVRAERELDGAMWKLICRDSA